MSETNETDEKKPLRLSQPGRLELRKLVETGEVRQSFSHGRSKAVTVEVRRKRTFAPGEGGGMTEVKPRRREQQPAPLPQAAAPAAPGAAAQEPDGRQPIVLKTLTDEEKVTRARALENARQQDREAREEAAVEAKRKAEGEARLMAEREAAEKRVQEEEERKQTEEEARRKAEEDASRRLAEVEQPAALLGEASLKAPISAKRRAELADEEAARGRGGKGEVRRSTLAARRGEPRRRAGKLTISQALAQEDRMRSLASVRRARERERRAQRPKAEPVKVVREVVLPETITVQELANRMAVRGADVVKALMKMGSMATINQSIDADSAELLIQEFGHKLKRVSEADVEIGLKGDADPEDTLKPRPPVVTVMGHVDHGKTSLLDALRHTDVVSGEAGGITQHIGAYQVTLDSGAQICFIDTPGHEAFTMMRARGANATDIVVLVVAADDGVMPQTIEAINHAKAAEAPIIVAINKIDRPDADPGRVRNELLNHDLVVEEHGGEVLSIEVSATERLNLDKLEEAIVLQAEILDLKANPDRPAEGVVVEARLDRGRGSVATVLVQRGTLRVGDLVVVGGEWGRVRALVDDRGGKVEEAGPGVPVEILGLSGIPEAGDEVVAVESERRAREITDYRQTLLREKRAATGVRGTVEQMFADIEAGKTKTLPVVIKADVHGSVEAIAGSLEKLGTDEVAIEVLHSGVGGINESDVTLAHASGALILGFNVRANAQARELARRDQLEIRYYSVIYDLIDDLKTSLSGLLPPALRERIIGNAQVLEVFDITKVGKIAGCRVTDGVIKRTARVRLLRDDTVIYEGKLATLKRFKDDAREVKEGLECGMAFENYHDLRDGDVIEAFEVEEIARSL
ncbi:MAG: translation initiation factor IF-2 [Proteobacteria bacterium]|nr:translation initiation factor IF-2 [Pseudomonadota bacterium]